MTPAPVPAGPPGRVVTLTANPSLDRTLSLPAPLRRGEVARLGASSTEPGGKGVNVARAVAAAGAEVVCVFPAGSGDPFVGRLHALGLRLATVPVAAPVRTNYTLTEPDGTTTKLNEPGNPLDEVSRETLARVLHERAVGASWVALSGSLPPGTPDGWYADRSARCGTPAPASPSTPPRSASPRSWPPAPTPPPTCSSRTSRSSPRSPASRRRS
jgi:1-phosphofructokinase